jgi:hypothetical protein
LPLTPEQRRIRASLAAYAGHAKYDPRERTAAACDATPQCRPYWERHVRVEFPDVEADLRAKHSDISPGKLAALVEAEYARRAECLHKAHMQRLALKSSKARAARKAATTNDAAR